MVSAPIAGATAAVFTGEYLQYWTETDADWTDVPSASFELVPAKGYSLWGVAKGAYTFTGTPNTGNQSIGITANGTGGSFNGANLLGNPYPSSIDWDLVSGYGAVYYWDGSQYLAYPETGSYGIGSQYVPPMQGFFVVVGSSGTFSLTNALRTHNGATSYYKSEKALPANSIKLVAKSNTYNNELFLRLDNNALENFEQSRDAYKLLSGTAGMPELYSFANDKMLSIDVRPACEQIQLGFENSQNGNYSIDIKEMDGIVSAQIEDTKTNILHNFATGAYQFDYLTSDNSKRFILHLSMVGIDEPETGTGIEIYSNNQNIFIRSDNSINNSSLTICDLMGRVLFEQELTGDNLFTVPVNLSTGVYVVSVQTAEVIRSEKVFVK